MNNAETFDDVRTPIPAPFDPFENAPTLHFSDRKAITREDLKQAIERGTKPRPSVGWEAKR